MNKKIFKNENFIKYSTNYIAFNREKRKLRKNFKNFLWIWKIYQRWIRNRLLHPRPYRFSKPSNYFWWRLRAWGQDSKWQNKKRLVRPLLRLKKHQKIDMRNYKYSFSKRGFKGRHKGRNKGRDRKKTWKFWLKKNRHLQQNIKWH